MDTFYEERSYITKILLKMGKYVWCESTQSLINLVSRTVRI